MMFTILKYSLIVVSVYVMMFSIVNAISIIMMNIWIALAFIVLFIVMLFVMIKLWRWQ